MTMYPHPSAGSDNRSAGGEGLVVAVDLGGTHARAAAVAPDGTVACRERVPTPHDAVEPLVLLDLVDRVRRAVAGADGTDVGVSPSTIIGLPGVVDYRRQRLVAAPNLPSGWQPFLCREWLQSRLGGEVELANDADLAAVGEARFGAGRGRTDVAFVTISTGVGAGAVLGGRLIRGRYSGLELGHTIIDRVRALAGLEATVELLGSGSALARAGLAAGLGPVTGADVVGLVRSGSPATAPIWEDAMAAAGLGIVNLCWMLSPELVVVGGGVGMNWELVKPILSEMLAHFGPTTIGTELVPAALGDDAALAGAGGWRAAVGREAGHTLSADRSVTADSAESERTVGG